MKKTSYFISRLASAACMLLVCGAMVSCSDDDDSNGGSGGGAPSGEDIGVTDRVVAIEGNYGGTSIFNYTDGVMTSGRTMIDNLDFTISYDPVEIWAGIVEDDGFYEEYEENYKNIRTNSFGAIVSADMTYHEKDMYEEYEDNSTMSAKYDGNNRIQQLEINESGGDGGYTYEDNVRVEYTWEGNNITEMNLVYNYSETEDGDVYEEEYNEGFIFVYGDGAVKNSGVYHPVLVLDLDFFNYAGFFGRTTAELPTAVIYTVDGEERDRYDYEVDVDGQDRVTFISDGDETFTYYYADTYNPGSLRQAAKIDGSRKTRSGILSKIKSRMLKHRMVK